MSAPGAFWTRWRVRMGYPLAVVFLVLARPTLTSLGIGAAFAFLGLIIRAVAAGELRKHQELASTGIYSMTRNPLYFGSALIALGFAVAGFSWFAALLLAIYFYVFYSAVMKREEAELRARYGSAFEEYAARTPLFWPRVPARGTAGMHFSWVRYTQNREYQALLGVVLGLTVLGTKVFWKWW